MAEKSQYDFVGAWCHDEDGGLLHVANHHIAPGKKQGSWGHREFGQAWDKSLTDNNGPYIELMTGILPITSLILPGLMLTRISVSSSISCLIILWAWCKMPPAMR